MGVQGLLPKLKSITQKVHISQLKGQRIAVDAYCLLHKGAYTCARELVEGIPTDKCVAFCMGRIAMLMREELVPYVVFDGGPLPNKKEEEDARALSRRENREKARLLWNQGSKTAAMEYYQKAVDITPDIAYCLIEELQKRNIAFVVAPYEADAQCAYLAHQGLVDVVMTEDSDLLAYGCPKVLYKMDGNGEADMICFDDLPHCRDLSFVGWNLELFQQMCVMAGCDFVKALPGIGIKKAHTHIRRTRNIVKAMRALKFDGIPFPPGYDAKVQRALWTFKYQRVYCPRQNQVVHLHTLPEGGLENDSFISGASRLADGESDFLGSDISQPIAQGVAEGRLNPFTYKTYTAVMQFPRFSSQESCASLKQPMSKSEKSEVAVDATDRARKPYKRPRSVLESRKLSQDCVSLTRQSDSVRQGDRNMGSNTFSRFSQGASQRPAARPLKSLKDILSSALSCDDSSMRKAIEKGVESGYGPHADENELNDTTGGRDTEKIPFTPIWRPRSCLSERKGEQEATSPAATHEGVTPFQKSTPGIYLSDNDIIESPENEWCHVTKSFSCSLSSPKTVHGTVSALRHMEAVSHEATAAVDTIVRRSQKALLDSLDSEPSPIDTSTREKSIFDSFAFKRRQLS